MGLIDVGETIDKVTKVFDDNYLSRQEIEDTRTRRHEIDTTSPFKLPHLIRPILALWSAGLHTAVSITGLVMGADPLIIIGTSTTIMIAIIGFYFNARKAEKINAKKVMAVMEMEENRAKVEIKKEEALIVQTKRQDRIDNRERRRENRKN